MIGRIVKNYLMKNQLDIVKPANEVAVVNVTNTLEHALLILTTDQYSIVPVLDNDSNMCGIISMAKIIQAIVGMDEVRFDKLSMIKVKDIIDEDYVSVMEDFDLENVLHKLVDTSFITVVDKENKFKGIITRSVILKGLNRIAHNLEVDYRLTESEVFST